MKVGRVQGRTAGLNGHSRPNFWSGFDVTLAFVEVLVVLQPKGDIFDNLECRYAEYFMFDYDYMGLKDDKNRWAQIGALERFHQPWNLTKKRL